MGDTASIRKPVKFSVTDGATASIQDVTESSTPFVINKRKHVAWSFTTQDLTLTIEEYSDRYIQPAMISLANQVDSDLAALYKTSGMLLVLLAPLRARLQVSQQPQSDWTRWQFRRICGNWCLTRKLTGRSLMD